MKTFAITIVVLSILAALVGFGLFLYNWRRNGREAETFEPTPASYEDET